MAPARLRARRAAASCRGRRGCPMLHGASGGTRCVSSARASSPAGSTALFEPLKQRRSTPVDASAPTATAAFRDQRTRVADDHEYRRPAGDSGSSAFSRLIKPPELRGEHHVPLVLTVSASRSSATHLTARTSPIRIRVPSVTSTSAGMPSSAVLSRLRSRHILSRARAPASHFERSPARGQPYHRARSRNALRRCSLSRGPGGALPLGLPLRSGRRPEGSLCA